MEREPKKPRVETEPRVLSTQETLNLELYRTALDPGVLNRRAQLVDLIERGANPDDETIHETILTALADQISQQAASAKSDVAFVVSARDLYMTLNILADHGGFSDVTLRQDLRFLSSPVYRALLAVAIRDLKPREIGAMFTPSCDSATFLQDLAKEYMPRIDKGQQLVNLSKGCSKSEVNISYMSSILLSGFQGRPKSTGRVAMYFGTIEGFALTPFQAQRRGLADGFLAYYLWAPLIFAEVMQKVGVGVHAGLDRLTEEDFTESWDWERFKLLKENRQGAKVDAKVVITGGDLNGETFDRCTDSTDSSKWTNRDALEFMARGGFDPIRPCLIFCGSNFTIVFDTSFIDFVKMESLRAFSFGVQQLEKAERGYTGSGHAMMMELTREPDGNILATPFDSNYRGLQDQSQRESGFKSDMVAGGLCRMYSSMKMETIAFGAPDWTTIFMRAKDYHRLFARNWGLPITRFSICLSMRYIDIQHVALLRYQLRTFLRQRLPEPVTFPLALEMKGWLLPFTRDPQHADAMLMRAIAFELAAQWESKQGLPLPPPNTFIDDMRVDAAHRAVFELAYRRTFGDPDANLFTACQSGDLGAVRDLLASGAAPNEQNEDGNTPLHIASRFDYAVIAEPLLNAGARFDIANLEGDTALKVACWSLSKHVAALLKKRGADVNQEYGDPPRPLVFEAVESDQLQAAELLIGLGADVKKKYNGETLLKTLVVSFNFLRDDDERYHYAERAAKFLLENNANPNEAGDKTLLLSAVENGHQGIAELLLKHGAIITDDQKGPLLEEAERFDQYMEELIKDAIARPE